MSVHRHLHLLNVLKERAITLLYKVIEVNGVCAAMRRSSTSADAVRRYTRQGTHRCALAGDGSFSMFLDNGLAGLPTGPRPPDT
jgi:hypothetical protein